MSTVSESPIISLSRSTRKITPCLHGLLQAAPEHAAGMRHGSSVHMLHELLNSQLPSFSGVVSGLAGDPLNLATEELVERIEV